ncbi:acrosin-binding protein-like [Anomaloglossus baeobatrachus]
MTYQNAFIIFWWAQAILTFSMANDAYLVAPGSPLSGEEYEQFMKLIHPEKKAKHLCDIRRVAGCDDPQVYGFDLVENHGLIPKGPICTESILFP